MQPWREKLLAQSAIFESSEALAALSRRRGSASALGQPLPRSASFIPAAVSQMRLPTRLDGTHWDEPSARERRIARRLMFALNMAVLWSYQSLLSAQALYELRWPTAHLSFVGTVACTATMAVGQLLLLATGVGARARFSVRLVSGFIAFAAIGATLLARPSAGAIVLAFAATGALNCVTESPLYSLASQCWPDDELTAALNAGNGAAGAANVLILACIRLATVPHARGEGGGGGGSSAGDGASALELANSIFLSLMVLVSLAAIGLSWVLLRLPTISARARARMELAKLDDGGGLRALLLQPRTTFAVECAPYLAVWPHVRVAALCQVGVLVVSLMLWPGIACAALPPRWAERGMAAWWCSPAIVGCFNVTDLLGRVLASWPLLARRLPLRRCAQLVAARALLAPPLALAASSARAGAPLPLVSSGAAVLLCVCALGLSNGLLATRTMCIGPELVPEEARGVAAGVMVLSLYWGIGLGAMAGLAYGELSLF